MSKEAVTGEFLDTLRAGLEELGLERKAEILDACAVYHGELKRWSRAYNITGLKDDREMAIHLFLDSLLYLKAFPPEPARPRVLDVGSGGGFPGVVLKIARPELDLCLLEPSWKRAGFLRHICRVLRLSRVTVIESTLEEHARADGDTTYDVIVTRALFRTYDFIRKTAGILGRRGVLILGKGPLYREEMREVEKRLGSRPAGLDIETVSFRLPQAGIERYFIRVTRV